MAELLGKRGLFVDASCVWRWVQTYGPELNKRCRHYLKKTNKSYRVDETYINIKGKDRYLYRAVDSSGQTIDFLLTPKRDAESAKRFFRKMFSAEGNTMARVINVDKNPAYPAAIRALKAEGTLPRRVQLRQCRYLNNVVEHDHRFVKKRVWLAKGYGSFLSAWRTLQGIEAMNIRKGRVRSSLQSFRHHSIRGSGKPPLIVNFALSMIPAVLRNGTVDKNPAYSAAVKEMQAEESLRRQVRLRQCKYLNNIVEQEHRFVKKRVWLATGYGSFRSAWRTLQGIEAFHIIRKGRVRWLSMILLARSCFSHSCSASLHN